MIAGCLDDVCYGFDCTPSWACCSLVAFSLLLRSFVSLVVGGVRWFEWQLFVLLLVGVRCCVFSFDLSW